MRILMSGTNGFIGSAVAAYLASQGHEIVRLVRRAPGAGEVRWDPDAGIIDGAGLEGQPAHGAGAAPGYRLPVPLRRARGRPAS